MKPYIGVTGFMSSEEAAEALTYLPKKSNRDFQIGVLVSDKTLRGQPNKHPKIFPKISEISRIFSADPRALNLVHFHTDETRDWVKVRNDLIAVAQEFGGSRMHGFQLNLDWPDVKELMVYHKVCSPKRTVLEISSRVLAQIGHSPEALRERVVRYSGVITDILLDPSGGTGQPLNPLTMRDYLRVLRGIGVHVGVAGGLESRTLHSLVRPLAQEFPGLSIDAQGKLRDELGNLDILKVGAYITEASYMFERLEEYS